jgi:uncharacterized membrane protein YkoI
VINYRTKIIAALAALLGFGATADRVFAEDRDEHARERSALRNARLTLEDAIEVARRKLPGGRVIDADVETRNGVVSYAIDIDRDGVRRVLVDPSDGKVVNVAAKRDDGGSDEDGDDDDDDDDEGPRRP